MRAEGRLKVKRKCFCHTATTSDELQERWFSEVWDVLDANLEPSDVTIDDLYKAAGATKQQERWSLSCAAPLQRFGRGMPGLSTCIVAAQVQIRRPAGEACALAPERSGAGRGAA